MSELLARVQNANKMTMRLFGKLFTSAEAKEKLHLLGRNKHFMPIRTTCKLIWDLYMEFIDVHGEGIMTVPIPSVPEV